MAVWFITRRISRRAGKVTRRISLARRVTGLVTFIGNTTVRYPDTEAEVRHGEKEGSVVLGPVKGKATMRLMEGRGLAVTISVDGLFVCRSEVSMI